MSEHIQVEGEPGLVRDSRSRAIISVDKDAYLEFKERMAKKRAEEARLAAIEHKMERIESMMAALLEKLS